jgi:hypothetical protein
MPAKIKGIEFYSVDVDHFTEPRISKLVHKFGPLGYMTYMVLLSHIYSKGYYVNYDLTTAAYLVLKYIPSKFISGKDKLQEMIKYMVSIDLFDQELYQKEVFTSIEIQEMFEIAAKKRKQAEEYPYWLLGELKTETEVDVEKVKIKKTRTEKRKDQKMIDIEENAPKKHFLTKVIIEEGYISDYSADLYKYDVLFEELINEYGYRLIQEATRYLAKYYKKLDTDIEDRYRYFESSIKKNLKMITMKPVTDKSTKEMLDELLGKKSLL